MLFFHDPVFVIASKTLGGLLQRALARVCHVLDTAVEEFTGFHEFLEDEDHGGDEKEEVQMPWGLRIVQMNVMNFGT